LPADPPDAPVTQDDGLADIEAKLAEHARAIAERDAAVAAREKAGAALRALQSKFDKLTNAHDALRADHDALQAKWTRIVGTARSAPAIGPATPAGATVAEQWKAAQKEHGYAKAAEMFPELLAEFRRTHTTNAKAG
jgi:uncharacterized coiled-coil protein SlyX